jgi:hypothetical protein
MATTKQKSYKGKERRSAKVCPFHPELIEAHAELKRSTDTILRNQSDYMLRQMSVIEDITHIKDTVDNGLKTTVKETADRVEELKGRITILDEFEWFREWVNDFRNKLFKRIMTLAVGGGLLAAVCAGIFFGVYKIFKVFIH